MICMDEKINLQFISGEMQYKTQEGQLPANKTKCNDERLCADFINLADQVA